jgi:hypothetical protein
MGGEGKFRIPSEMGKRGIPSGVGGSSPKKSGFVVPSETGNRGKPVKKGFPGNNAPKD